MKIREKSRSKRPERRMVIEAATSDSPVSAFISLLRPAEGEWPMMDSVISGSLDGKKAAIR